MASFNAVKITLSGAETRRFPASALPLHSLSEMRARLATEFPSAGSNPQYALSYLDEEGDRVTIGSQSEWDGALDCLRTAHNNKVACFTISTAHQPSKGETHQPPFAFLSELLNGLQGGAAGEGSSAEDVPPLFGMLESILPMVGEIEMSLAEGNSKGGEHPGHIAFPFPGIFGMPPCGPPAAGAPASPTKPNACPAAEAHSANLDAVRLMEAKDYEGAEAVLEVAIDRWPEHTASWYNMACAASLAGNHGKALASLSKAFELGYANHRLLATDPDLDALRALPDFNDLLVSLACPHGFHMGRYLNGCKARGRYAQGSAGLAALMRQSEGRPDFFAHLPIGARGVVSGAACAAAIGEGGLGLAAMRSFAAGIHDRPAPSTRPTFCGPHGRMGWKGLQGALSENAAELALLSGLPGYEEFVAEVGQRVAEEMTTTHLRREAPLPQAEQPEFQMSEAAVEAREADKSASQEEEKEEEPAADPTPFPFAREFAEVRSTGIAVPDTVLRSLLLTHQGDVCAVMSELCTTPR